MKDTFRKVANKISAATGTSTAFLIALSIIIIWGVTGPVFNFSDTWQLIINTGTTIVTFLMVFLIQNTQNRDSKAMQLKLDELIRSTTARDGFVDLEDLKDEELAALDQEFHELHEKEATSAMMRKLHSRVTAENKRRQSMKRHAGQMMNFLNPLSNDKSKNL